MRHSIFLCIHHLTLHSVIPLSRPASAITHPMHNLPVRTPTGAMVVSEIPAAEAPAERVQEQLGGAGKGRAGTRLRGERVGQT